MKKPGRNHACPCGSGSKYKKCCLSSSISSPRERRTLHRNDPEKLQKELLSELMKFALKFYGRIQIDRAFDVYCSASHEKIDLQNSPEWADSFAIWFLFTWTPAYEKRAPVESELGIPPAIKFQQLYSKQWCGYQKTFLNEVQSQPMSFFVIDSVISGKSLELTDLLLGEKTTIQDSLASSVLQKDFIIYARVITIDGIAHMCEAPPYAISPGCRRQVEDFQQTLRKQHTTLDKNSLIQMEETIRGFYFDLLRQAEYSTDALLDEEGEEIHHFKLVFSVV